MKFIDTVGFRSLVSAHSPAPPLSVLTDPGLEGWRPSSPRCPVHLHPRGQSLMKRTRPPPAPVTHGAPSPSPPPPLGEGGLSLRPPRSGQRQEARVGAVLPHQRSSSPEPGGRAGSSITGQSEVGQGGDCFQGLGGGGTLQGQRLRGGAWSLGPEAQVCAPHTPSPHRCCPCGPTISRRWARSRSSRSSGSPRTWNRSRCSR